MSTVCCVCQQKLSSENNKKNIFKDDLIIRNESEKSEGINDTERAMKLYSGIELITHQKIFETCGSPMYLCDPCFKKLEGFIKFREQVLASFGIIFNGQSSFNPLKQKSLDSEPGKSKLEDSRKNSDLDSLEEEISDSPKLPDRKSAPEDLINVDESSISVDVDIVENEEIDTNDSLSCSRLQNDQDNNNLNESDSSSDHIDVQRCEDSPPPRVQESDIESEIDVCSGDDDEILEMQSQRKEHILDVESSSESEIEVCDYEPTGKRIKNLNNLSQALPF